MSAGDLARHFNTGDVVKGGDVQRDKAGGYTIGGEESVYPDAAEMANFKEPSYSRARTLVQAYMDDPNVANQVDGWTAQFEAGQNMPWQNGGLA
tara:strand:+ start:68 stop:349 length:282 start_codon:yes stop_codon:yes gene_type:complete